VESVACVKDFRFNFECSFTNRKKKEEKDSVSEYIQAVFFDLAFVMRKGKGTANSSRVVVASALPERA
jgi:hypothetical protein